MKTSAIRTAIRRHKGKVYVWVSFKPSGGTYVQVTKLYLIRALDKVPDGKMSCSVDHDALWIGPIW